MAVTLLANKKLLHDPYWNKAPYKSTESRKPILIAHACVLLYYSKRLKNM